MASTTDPTTRDDEATTSTASDRELAARPDATSGVTATAAAPSEARAVASRGGVLAQRVPLAVAGVLLVGVLVTALRFGGPAVVLLLAFAALAGAILLFWEAVRAVLDPNAPGDEVALEGAGQVPSDLEVRKRAALRALKDIEFEHSIHRLSDEDYQALRERYRAEARAAMEAIDKALSAYLPRAEALIAKAARGELTAGETDEPAPARAKKNRRKPKPEEAVLAAGATESSAAAGGASAASATVSASASAVLSSASAASESTTTTSSTTTTAEGVSESGAGDGASASDAAKAETTAPATASGADRRACASCGTSNEPDATFCKRCGAKVATA